jgi:hypothetical protein
MFWDTLSVCQSQAKPLPHHGPRRLADPSHKCMDLSDMLPRYTCKDGGVCYSGSSLKTPCALTEPLPQPTPLPSFLTPAGPALGGGEMRLSTALPSPLLSLGPWEPGLRWRGCSPQTGNASLGSCLQEDRVHGLGAGGGWAVLRVSSAGCEGFSMGTGFTDTCMCDTGITSWSPSCSQSLLHGPGWSPLPFLEAAGGMCSEPGTQDGPWGANWRINPVTASAFLFVCLFNFLFYF